MTETVHQCPPDNGGGVMPCCGLSPFEVPRTDRITLDPALVTCPVCRDSGVVSCPDPDRESMYETACPEPVHDGPVCEVDGNNIDTYGAERYWHCGRPGVITVDGTLMCEDHAGERGYGPKQAEFGFDPDDGHNPTPDVTSALPVIGEGR